MAYLGELISIGVAFSWTATALLSEFGSKRLGNLTLNVLRMALALLFSLVLFWVVMGSPLPPIGSMEACGWMLLSGLVGYVIGDFCLFQCYIIIGSRYGQLFMTLAPLSAALMAWVGVIETPCQWSAFCRRSRYLSRCRTCVEQDRHGPLSDY